MSISAISFNISGPNKSVCKFCQKAILEEVTIFTARSENEIKNEQKLNYSILICSLEEYDSPEKKNFDFLLVDSQKSDRLKDLRIQIIQLIDICLKHGV